VLSEQAHPAISLSIWLNSSAYHPISKFYPDKKGLRVMENQITYKQKSQQFMDQVKYERAPRRHSIRPSRVAGIVLLSVVNGNGGVVEVTECGLTGGRIARRILFNAPVEVQTARREPVN